jgi:hypothetical protein
MILTTKMNKILNLYWVVKNDTMRLLQIIKYKPNIFIKKMNFFFLHF